MNGLTYNPLSTDKKVIIDVFHCLIALIIAKYSKSDVLRYIFPEQFREEVGKPQSSSDSWKITYWFQSLIYWFRHLFTEKRYTIHTPIQGDDDKLLKAMNYIRENIKKKDYIRLMKADDRFHNHLDILFRYILTMHPDMRTPIPRHKTSCSFGYFNNGFSKIEFSEPDTSSKRRSYSLAK